MLTLMALFASLEARWIKERAAQAREAARMRGRQVGRKPAHAEGKREYGLLLLGQGVGLREASRRSGIPVGTLSRYRDVAAAEAT
jgi:DNA invertase Pin-like site-specific DNA recombinase